MMKKSEIIRGAFLVILIIGTAIVAWADGFPSGQIPPGKPSDGIVPEMLDQNGKTQVVSPTNPVPTTSATTTTTTTGSVASSLVLKTSAGKLVGASITTGSTAGYFMLFNSASVPADGAVTPWKCYEMPANTSLGVLFGNVNFSNGIVEVFSSTGCFIKTASATAFMSGDVQ